MKPNTIIFDFGGVLLDWDPRYLYRKIFNGDEEGMERFLAEVDFYHWNSRQDEGRPFSVALREGCQNYPQYCELLNLYRERWIESIAGPLQGTVEILAALKQAGYPLYGLSNWSAETFHLVSSQYPFLSWFERIILSGEVRLVKPDPRIFELTLTQIGRQAPECLLIDDSLHNITTAQSLGFQTIHFQSPQQLRQELINFGLLANEGILDVAS